MRQLTIAVTVTAFLLAACSSDDSGDSRTDPLGTSMEDDDGSTDDAADDQDDDSSADDDSVDDSADDSDDGADDDLVDDDSTDDSPDDSADDDTGSDAGVDADCYSPTQNADTAYEPDAEGCACDADQQGVCVGDAAMVCQDGSWQAVQDGPCAVDLACEGRLEAIEDCMHYFDICVEMDNGLFCGLGHRTDECAGEIVESPAGCLQDDAYCTELESGKYCTGSAAPSCPEFYVPADNGCPDTQVFWCFQYSESLACQLGELSEAECKTAGGTGVYDPGDGSVSSKGCPDGRQALGFLVPGGIEGALCCGADPK